MFWCTTRFGTEVIQVFIQHERYSEILKSLFDTTRISIEIQVVSVRRKQYSGIAKSYKLTVFVNKTTTYAYFSAVAAAG